MESKPGFSKLLQFFRDKQPALPGNQEFSAAFCRILVAAGSAEEASIWQLDSKNRLHPVYGTNFTSEEISEIILREGEGIGGAVVNSRQTMAVSQALGDPQHDSQLDERIGFRTRSMISAPILFGDMLYGVINILNHASGQAFPLEWNEKLSAVGVMYAAALAAADRLCLYDGSSNQNDRRAARVSEYKTVVVGASCPIQEALHLCVKAAMTDIPVLVLGETGTGKELAARRIHEAGSRANGPFIDVNCAAITETILESELFGHVKGAFSGATQSRRGKFVAAEGGTLFLDEIGNMSQSCQAKILRVLQEKKLSPVGSEKTVKCDARIVAATNQDLKKKVAEGRFREDLFYRLCGIEILMPPLRDRPEDIPLLVNHILKRAGDERKERDPLYQTPALSSQALQMLTAFNWPGNVRQLEQAVSAALAICDTDEVRPDDFPNWFLQANSTCTDMPMLPPVVESYRPPEKTPSIIDGRNPHQERSRYLQALEATQYQGTGRWNLSAAARQLNIPRKTFVYQLKQMQLIK